MMKKFIILVAFCVNAFLSAAQLNDPNEQELENEWGWDDVPHIELKKRLMFASRSGDANLEFDKER